MEEVAKKLDVVGDKRMEIMTSPDRADENANENSNEGSNENGESSGVSNMKNLVVSVTRY